VGTAKSHLYWLIVSLNHLQRLLLSAPNISGNWGTEQSTDEVKGDQQASGRAQVEPRPFAPGLAFYLFCLLGLGFELWLHTIKQALCCLSHTSVQFVLIILEMGFHSPATTHTLASNHEPPGRSIPNSQDYSCEPCMPGSRTGFLKPKLPPVSVAVLY
jgi:hypothetical protein